jgi:hypothetical protein
MNKDSILQQDRPSANELLDLIDRFLVESPEAKALWDIMGAVRGPDSEDDDEKLDHTCPVRCAAFPQTAKRGLAYAIFINGRYKEPAALGHFGEHIRCAVTALDTIGRPVRR